jgi:hypothetical protein
MRILVKQREYSIDIIRPAESLLPGKPGAHNPNILTGWLNNIEFHFFE